MTFLHRIVVTCICFAIAAASGGGEAPSRPRLASDGVRIAGGFQLERGGDGVFELFGAAVNGDDLRSLGRFHGHLAGVAVDDDEVFLALTRDGALARYDEAVRRIAEPDARWNMVGLLLFDGQPVAFHNDDTGRLFPVRLDGNGDWQQAPVPAAVTGELRRLEAVVVDGRPHLIWSARADDLSEGALRHVKLVNGIWQEEAPLPVGNVTAFTAFSPAPGQGGGSIAVVTVRHNILDGDNRRLDAYGWQDGRWNSIGLPAASTSGLEQALSFAAAGTGTIDAPPVWLVTGARGAFFSPSVDGSDAVAIRVGGEAATTAVGASRTGSLVTFVAIALLALLSCRRSRALSRMFPARPPDLFSRAAALMTDWLLVSLAMSGYHLASGDVLIVADLLLRGEVRGIIWSNLAALIAFTAVAEGLWGCTPGKYLAGLRVRSVFGGKPLFFQGVLRNLLRVVDMFPLPIAFPGLIGLVAVVLGPRRQRIGDMMASTIVRRHAPLRDRHFLLASASPRRMELLSALGIQVRAEAMDVNENAVTGMTPDETVRALAQTKARAAAGSVRPGEVVVAADTIVVLDGAILNKPADADDAAAMLRRLSGRSHSVFTGVAVWDSLTSQALVDVDETEVEFRDLSDREIADYVASGDPMDKAGGYGVQSGFLVKQVRGSLSNVAGLPMEKTIGMLMQLDS